MLETTWSRFFDVLRTWRPFRGRFNHPGWVPATFAPMTRTLANVRSVAALVLHVEGRGLAVDDVARAWGDCYGLVQTTDRHTAETLSALVVVPYGRATSLQEHARVAEWAQTRSRGGGLPTDHGARNPARWLYLPGTVPGAPFEARMLDGDLLDPGAFAR
jgi:hypothetical protein